MKLLRIVVFTVFLLVSGAKAQTTQPPLITVSGKGQIKIVPDMVVINLSVETFDVSLSLAKMGSDQKIEQILKVLKESGIKGSDIRTYNFNLDERKTYEPSNSQRDTLITRYHSSQSIKVTLNSITQYSEIVEGLINSDYKDQRNSVYDR
ncbi:MAG TPA: SIMPL domain-containing protein [Patescibacteria group bacterium]|nr:SIMPL domain-containing protein [Patescibacteria group bacterium]